MALTACVDVGEGIDREDVHREALLAGPPGVTPGRAPKITVDRAPDPLPAEPGPAELAKMKAHVARISVDPADVVKILEPSPGEIYDCVRPERQPALRDPRMAGHALALRPHDALPRFDEKVGLRPGEEEAFEQYPGFRCPDGTVPVARRTLDDFRRFPSLAEALQKTPLGRPLDPIDPRAGADDLHQYAVAHKWVDGRGGSTALNLWSPYTEADSEFSLSQMWVVGGEGDDKETVEAGWQVYDQLYGDARARLFIFFNPDDYGDDSCYNLDCNAFVQVADNIFIGGGFSNYSETDGNQRVARLTWFQDTPSGHWWLRYGSTWVGYYPGDRFDDDGLGGGSERVSFGGEIIDRQPGGRHTRTDMGSGAFPYLGFRKAAYQRSLRYIDDDATSRQIRGFATRMDDRWCYDIELTEGNGTWESYFYFGGSGYNTYCE